MPIFSWKEVQDNLELTEKILILVRKHPNDQKLGEEIRKLVNLKKDVKMKI